MRGKRLPQSRATRFRPGSAELQRIRGTPFSLSIKRNLHTVGGPEIGNLCSRTMDGVFDPDKQVHSGSVKSHCELCGHASGPCPFETGKFLAEWMKPHAFRIDRLHGRIKQRSRAVHSADLLIQRTQYLIRFQYLRFVGPAPHFRKVEAAGDIVIIRR